MRRAAAHNPRALPGLLTKLVADAEGSVRVAVAFHATAWPELLAGLAHDELAAVRWAVARNSATPFDVQSRAA